MGKTKLIATDESIYRIIKEMIDDKKESESICVLGPEELERLTMTRTTGWVAPRMVVNPTQLTKRNSEEIKKWNDRIDQVRKTKSARRGYKKCD